MGDWISMEIKRRERRPVGKNSGTKSITSVFFRYICFYTAGALFWLFIIFAVYFMFGAAGEILPANHMEVQLNASVGDIRKAPEVTEDMLPRGCTFGVYEYDGTLIYGTFSPEEAVRAWEHYEEDNIYGRWKRYYLFFVLDTKEICIVRYEIATRFRNAYLSEFFPNPDILAILSFVVLFLIHTVLVSRHYGRYMGKRISVLNEVTAKIRNQNLEFGKERSEIKEVDEVLDSLHQMKEALRDSLYRQWNLEKSKEEQIAALAHDIKTPLTVIRGNAELMAEGELSEDERGFNRDILQSASVIAEYLMILNEILLERGGEGETQEYDCREIINLLKERARILAKARHFEILFCETDLHEERKILCNEGQITRAFENILNNAIDYTPADGKVEIRAETAEKGASKYLAVIVTDEGPGFTKEGLERAAEQFYQGDRSRSNKNHYGIGLYTAERFVKTQGGYLSIKNTETRGAEVSLYILFF